MTARAQERFEILLAKISEGERRAPSHCRFVLQHIHFMPDSLTYSVPLFLKRQCDRTPGERAVLLEKEHDIKFMDSKKGKGKVPRPAPAPLACAWHQPLVHYVRGSPHKANGGGWGGGGERDRTAGRARARAKGRAAAAAAARGPTAPARRWGHIRLSPQC
jgi:hypothetical protein